MNGQRQKAEEQEKQKENEDDEKLVLGLQQLMQLLSERPEEFIVLEPAG